MSDEPLMLRCPACDERFYVVWQRSATTGDGPEYCPFCGEEVDYSEMEEEARV